MYRQHKPPAFLVATTKLQHDWSANRAVPHISTEWLDELLSDSHFTDINSMAKIRLLLAGLLALDQAPLAAAGGGSSSAQDNGQQRAELQQALQRLRTAVGSDVDEWDKVMAAAAGPVDGRLDLAAVMRQSQAVQETMNNMKQQVAASSNQQLFPPREADFLQDPPSVLDPAVSDFVVRPNPRVQALAAGFSYAQATPPPPPSMLRAPGNRQARLAGAAGSTAAPGHRPQQAAGAAGGAGLFRAQSGHLDRGGHTVQLLGEEEQANLFKYTHHKHGVASAVKQEQLVYERPVRPAKPAQQQQQRRQQQQQPEPSHSRPTASMQPRTGGAASARADGFDGDIDALFEDDDDDVEGQGAGVEQPAATGVSRSARHHLQHRHPGRQGEEGAEGVREVTPEDLMDDMDEEQQQGVMQGVEEEVVGEGGDGSMGAEVGAVVGQQAAAGKRRRMHVIASDSEDDD